MVRTVFIGLRAAVRSYDGRTQYNTVYMLYSTRCRNDAQSGWMQWTVQSFYAATSSTFHHHPQRQRKVYVHNQLYIDGVLHAYVNLAYRHF